MNTPDEARSLSPAVQIVAIGIIPVWHLLSQVGYSPLVDHGTTQMFGRS